LGLLKAVKSAVELLEQDLDQVKVDSWSTRMTEIRGRLVLSGMGKSGLVAQKIAATFASTGFPSFFLHPAEALHGDLGMVTAEDSVLLLSNSGESDEILRLLPSLLRLGIPLAAITSKPQSSLGKAVHWTFGYALPEGEGCPLDLAPMASTTMQLLWGDLLAAEQMVRRGFTEEHFARYHPGGKLGVKLMKINEIMHSSWPKVSANAGLVEILQVMSDGKLGMAAVMAEDQILGVVSDGDIRRALQKAQETGRFPVELKAAEIMTSHPVMADGSLSALEAAGIMEARKITFLLVGTGLVPEGVLHIHDLLEAKVL
jgi:arabinose-5-phosphate isomerase